jgi:hypothetical protein
MRGKWLFEQVRPKRERVLHRRVRIAGHEEDAHMAREHNPRERSTGRFIFDQQDRFGADRRREPASTRQDAWRRRGLV